MWCALCLLGARMYYHHVMQQPGYSFERGPVVYQVLPVRFNGKPYFPAVDSARCGDGVAVCRLKGDTVDRAVIIRR